MITQVIVFEELGTYECTVDSYETLCRISTIEEKFKGLSEKEEYFQRIIHSPNITRITLLDLEKDWRINNNDHYYVVKSFNKYQEYGKKGVHIRAVFHFPGLPRLGNLENFSVEVLNYESGTKVFYKGSPVNNGAFDNLLKEIKETGLEDAYIRQPNDLVYKEWIESIIKFNESHDIHT